MYLILVYKMIHDTIVGIRLAFIEKRDSCIVGQLSFVMPV